ncbi:hypothetical protein U1Q18_030077 [Sarracenia purpurea var. burkii]
MCFDEIFCLFEGALHNLGSLKQQYGLAKSANETVLVIEAYKTLRDRAPYPANHVVGHLAGNFAFIVFDSSTSTLFVATVSNFTHSITLLTPAIYLCHSFDELKFVFMSEYRQMMHYKHGEYN